MRHADDLRHSNHHLRTGDAGAVLAPTRRRGQAATLAGLALLAVIGACSDASEAPAQAEPTTSAAAPDGEATNATSAANAKPGGESMLAAPRAGGESMLAAPRAGGDAALSPNAAPAPGSEGATAGGQRTRPVGAAAEVNRAARRGVGAEQRRARYEPQKPARTTLATTDRADEVVVKFREGSRVRLRGGRLDPTAAADTPARRSMRTRLGVDEHQVTSDARELDRLFASNPSWVIVPVFNRSEPELDAERAEGEARANEDLADLALYLYVVMPGATPAQTERLIDHLNALPSVEIAYAQPQSEAPAADIAPVTSSSQAMQNYMWDAPRGISASRAWARPGAGGNGLWFADIETGWRTDHEDFPAYNWQRGWNFTDHDHGTATVGVTSAPPNAYGVSGISAWATVNLYGIVQAIPPWDPSGTINLAASHLLAGEVILIEQHVPGPDAGACPPTACNCAQWGYIPVEWNQAEFDAIRNATARGIVVIEPAGNGAQNLDDPRYLNKFNLGVRDSEAVMVGAINSGEPGSGATFGGTSCFSDFGSRVDVSAWGDSVVTMGYGTGARPGFVPRVNGDDARQWYTDRFSGTSSASAIVAGAALGVNSALRTAGRSMESSLSMLLLFQATGTFVGTAGRPVGRQPNMDAALLTRGL